MRPAPSSSSTPPSRFLLPCLLALALLPGCQVKVVVGVDADAGGGGTVRATVTLDRAAAESVTDLAAQLRVADLEAAGWRIEGPETIEGGGSEITAVKDFETPDDATEVLQELAGPTGPFRDFRLRRSRSFFKTRTSITGSVDLSAGVDSFSDPRLKEQLGGTVLGSDVASFERRLGLTLAEAFMVEVGARLPGDVESNAPIEQGNRAAWRPRLGESISVVASSERWNTSSIAYAAGALVAAAAFVVVVLRRALTRREPSHPLPRV